MRSGETRRSPRLIIAALYSARHPRDDFLLGLIVRPMIKCSRSLPRQDNTRVSFRRKSRYLDFSKVHCDDDAAETDADAATNNDDDDDVDVDVDVGDEPGGEIKQGTGPNRARNCRLPRSEL